MELHFLPQSHKVQKFSPNNKFYPKWGHIFTNNFFTAKWNSIFLHISIITLQMKNHWWNLIFFLLMQCNFPVKRNFWFWQGVCSHQVTNVLIHGWIRYMYVTPLESLRFCINFFHVSTESIQNLHSNWADIQVVSFWHNSKALAQVWWPLQYNTGSYFVDGECTDNILNIKLFAFNFNHCGVGTWFSHPYYPL